jgi:hypothetical protein
VGNPIPAVFIPITPELSMIPPNLPPTLPDLAKALPHFGFTAGNLSGAGAAANVPTELRLVATQLLEIPTQFRSIPKQLLSVVSNLAMRWSIESRMAETSGFRGRMIRQGQNR